MYMKLKGGKSKVLTLSYDDAVVQDIRLISLMDKYGIKGTFNVNSGLYLDESVQREKFHGRMKLSEAKELYKNSGHEVAVHAYDHPFLEKLKPQETALQVLRDRECIEKEYGTIVRGMAYPYGTYNDEVIDVLRQCGICYSRTTHSTLNFNFPDNWLTLHPTCHHKNPKLMELAKRFLEDSKYQSANLMFYLWGHSYEFDGDDNWDVIEDFFKYVSFNDDVWYATNIEIYDYIKAYEGLILSTNGRRVYNPSMTEVWFLQGGVLFSVKGGEMIDI